MSRVCVALKSSPVDQGIQVTAPALVRLNAVIGVHGGKPPAAGFL
jgi:hypothetical protein